MDDRSLPETDSKFNNPPDRNAHPEIELVSEPKLCALLGNISSTTLWRQRRAGNFPKPIRISPGRVAWLKADIIAWLVERKAL